MIHHMPRQQARHYQYQGKCHHGGTFLWLFPTCHSSCLAHCCSCHSWPFLIVLQNSLFHST
nr:MAG TPA_asm: hypothetical protein [Caudoviricetes sp.]